MSRSRSSMSRRVAAGPPLALLVTLWASGSAIETFGPPAPVPPNVNYFDATLLDNGRPRPTRGYITDVFTDHAIQFIREHRQRPFFAYVAYNAPHAPYQVPDRYLDKYGARVRFGRGQYPRHGRESRCECGPIVEDARPALPDRPQDRVVPHRQRAADRSAQRT